MPVELVPHGVTHAAIRNGSEPFDRNAGTLGRMSTHAEKCERFLALHHGDTPLLLPNAWDRGTAKLFEFMGFAAVATTSGGHAATLGRLDGGVTLDEIIEHAAALAAEVDIPVSVDFENAFADEPTAVAAQRLPSDRNRGGGRFGRGFQPAGRRSDLRGRRGRGTGRGRGRRRAPTGGARSC